MDAENNTDAATTAIEKLSRTAANWTGLKIRIPARPVVPQLDALKKDVTQSISDLQARKHIFGTPPTLDEFLEPKEEAETRDSVVADIFNGPGGDQAIVAEVVREMAEKNNKLSRLTLMMKTSPENLIFSVQRQSICARNSWRHVYSTETLLQTFLSTY